MRRCPTLAVALACAAASQTAGAAQPLPDLTPFTSERTERLLRERYACLGCHRLGDEGGQIGPTLDGLAVRMAPGRVVAMIRDPAATLPGTRMPAQPMAAGEARRLAAYLLSESGASTAPPAGDAPTAPATPPPAPAAGPLDGAALYARHCAACHGERGAGDGWNAPDLPVEPTAHADSALMSRRPDDTLFDAIHAGGFVLDASPRMPAFGALLSTRQIQALVQHIRELCACRGPEWSRDGRARGR